MFDVTTPRELKYRFYCENVGEMLYEVKDIALSVVHERNSQCINLGNVFLILLNFAADCGFNVYVVHVSLVYQILSDVSLNYECIIYTVGFSMCIIFLPVNLC